MKTIATYSVKGGVGKTATAVNLSWLASDVGYRVLLVDLDPQAAATFYFRIKPRVKGGAEALVDRRRSVADGIKGTDFDRLHLLPGDFSYRNLDLFFDDTKKPTRQLRRLLKPLADDYDLVVLDCAPSISLASENVFEAADALLVPLIPTTLSVRTYEQLVSFLAAQDWAPPAMLPFFSLVERHKRMHRDTMEELAAVDGLLATVVPSAADIERMGRMRAPVGAFAPRSASAAAYQSLWADVASALGLDPRPGQPAGWSFV